MTTQFAHYKHFLIEAGTTWIQSQRDIYYGRGKPLSKSEIEVLKNFFNADILKAVRICPVSKIENPAFLNDLKQMGLPVSFNFSDSLGITFLETIVVATPKLHDFHWMSLLFHECIHVMQYTLLGLSGFVERYVEGLVSNDFIYNEISLEKDAYFIQNRFDENPDLPFSVLDVLSSRLQQRGWDEVKVHDI
ncbi:hypothetical protein ACFL27_01460 [candidate division CSSED10-310 bacterium]|uniref:DUF4157 domain-containing protein n=1 Tax=candidate division CSSED10-310 bacterium TaxID=2855610 RepID=A0ABV6YRN4_UNCC1